MASIKHSESFEIAQPVETLFPLFSPEGEKLWVPDWDYESFSAGTALHEGYVFWNKVACSRGERRSLDRQEV